MKKIKRIFSFLIALSTVLSAVPVFAQESLSADSSSISHSYRAEDPVKAKQLAEALVNASEFAVGEEKVFYTDAENTLSIKLTSIEEPTVTAFAASVNTPIHHWTITNTNALGIKYTVFEAELYAKYVPDGWDGYIISLNGTLSNIHSLWTVKWDDIYKDATDFKHSLGVVARSCASESSVIWTASYSPFDSSCRISKY